MSENEYFKKHKYFLCNLIRISTLYIRKYYDHERLLEIDAADYISATILH